MRRLVCLLVILTLTAGVARAQHEHHAKAHETAPGVKLEVRDDVRAHVLTLRLGPLNLPAHSDHMAVAQAPNLFWTIPFAGWLVAYHPRLVEAASGEALPGHLLHHVAFWNTGRSDFLCPNKEEHVFGAGGEMNEWPEVPGYGYRAVKGERIRIETMFHNPTDTSFPAVHLEVRIEYRKPGPGTQELRSVYPAWFDVMECRESAYDLRPGRNVTSGQVTMGYTGWLLGVGGHLHDYGQQLVLENRTRKEAIATLDARLDPQGRILSMPVVNSLAGVSGSNSGGPGPGYRLNRGDRVRVTATYDNRTGKPRPRGAMGIVVGYFLPDSPEQMTALGRKRK